MAENDQWRDDFGDPPDEGDARNRADDGWSDAERGGPPRSAGMSSGTKVLIVVASIAGVSVLLCCGGVVYIGSKFKPEIKINDPVAASATAAEIVTIDVPEQFRPSDSMKMNFGVMKMKMAMFKAQVGGGTVILAEMQMPAMPQQQDQEAQLRQSLRQQNVNNRELVVRESEMREFDVRGEKVKFLFAKAEEVSTGAAFRQVTGTFPSKQGIAILQVQVEEEHYDEEAVVKMLESIE